MLERINDLDRQYFNRESTATTYFLQQMRKKYGEDIDIDKIPDIGNVQKKFDIDGCFRGKSIAIEMKFCKTVKEPTYDWVLNKLYPHQLVNLKRRAKAGGLSILGCYHSTYNKFYFWTLQ